MLGQKMTCNRPGSQASWLYRYFFPRRFGREEKQPPPVPREELQAIFAQLMEWDAETWGHYYLSKDPLKFRVSQSEAREIIQSSLACAKDVHSYVMSIYGIRPAEALCQTLQIQLVREEGTQGNHAYLATFQEKPPKVRLFTRTADSAVWLVREAGLGEILGVELSDLAEGGDKLKREIHELMIAHELFHYFETCTPDIYTRRKLVTLPSLGSRERRSTLGAAGEIAATAFSQLYTGSRLSPGLVEMLVLCMNDLDYVRRICNNHSACSKA